MLGLALSTRDVAKIALLLDAGADVHYETADGWTVWHDALRTPPGEPADTLVAIVDLLLAHGADIHWVGAYDESALGLAITINRLDVARQLIAAGADPEWQLGWTELMRAVVFGDQHAVQTLLAQGADPWARDWRNRTAFGLSVHVGDAEKAKLLHAAGNTLDEFDLQKQMVRALSADHAAVLAWLLEQGGPREELVGYGTTPLLEAARCNATACVRLLLEQGADPHRTDRFGDQALSLTRDVETARLLLAAGADINHISDSVRPALLGLDAEAIMRLSQAAYEAGKRRRFGAANPERMDVAFWRAMVSSSLSAYAARNLFGDGDSWGDEPIWCFQRFGRTITQLPDGRIVEIGGEHEDSYDPDFCIYNDVVVHTGEGAFDIYGYPRDVFPPTDFHSATLVGDYIYLIGCLGYPHDRVHGETPVYRVHCESWQMQRVETSGENPGWISEHRAVRQGDSQIQITGGTIWTHEGGSTQYVDNEATYILDLAHGVWNRMHPSHEHGGRTT